LWRTQAGADKIAAWNKAHPDMPVAGSVLPKPSAAQLQDAINSNPGASGPMAAPLTVQPPKGVSSANRAPAESKEQLTTANQWLYRIELNTRSSGTGAQIVNF
jgi:hypothetical protein